MTVYTGQILLTAATFAPRGWYVCDGKVHPMEATIEYSSGNTRTGTDLLAEMIGTSFGGDGTTTFAVPNLMDQVPENILPIVCSQDSALGSQWPPASVPPAFDCGTDDPYSALVSNYATDYAPTNWGDCNGAVLPISQNTSLFSLIGNRFGGNGKSTFGLPTISDLVTFRLTPNAGQYTVESVPFSGTGGAAIAMNGLFPPRP